MSDYFRFRWACLGYQIVAYSINNRCKLRQKDPDNYASLLELGFREKLNEQRKGEKKAQQSAEQKRSRQDVKAPTSAVLTKGRKAQSHQSTPPLALPSANLSAAQPNQVESEAIVTPKDVIDVQHEPIVLIPLRTSSYSDW